MTCYVAREYHVGKGAVVLIRKLPYLDKTVDRGQFIKSTTKCQHDGDDGGDHTYPATHQDLQKEMQVSGPFAMHADLKQRSKTSVLT